MLAVVAFAYVSQRIVQRRSSIPRAISKETISTDRARSISNQPSERSSGTKEEWVSSFGDLAGLSPDQVKSLVRDSVEKRYTEALILLGKGGSDNDAKALEHFVFGAILGDPRCALEAAKMLEKGRGAPYDSHAVFKYYMIAASAGDPNAELRVADLFAAGSGTRTDYVAAGYWYEKAAKGGQPTALLAIGRLFANGQGYPQDRVTAFDYYRRAQTAGVRAADAAIGTAMINGWGTPADAEGGMDLLIRSATNGVLESAYALSQIYQQGAGPVTQDKAKALEWMNRAAESGYAVAQRALGQGFITGAWGVQDLTDAKYWLTKAGAQGDAQALADLGNIVAPTKEGYAEAYELAQKSAATGNPSGAFLLAQLSAYRKVDDPAAQHFVAKAAENGDWRSLYVQNLIVSVRPATS